MKKKKVIALIGVIVVVAALGGTGYYFRYEIGEFAGEKFENIRDMIPFLNPGNSDDKVYVEKVSKVMNTYTGASNRYNGVVETQDSYEVNVDSSRTIEEILVEEGDTVEEGQKLVTYDASELEMQVKQAKLEVESINNDIDNSKKKIARLNEQLSKTQDEDDKFDLTTEIQSEQNSIEQTEFDLESKNLEIEKLEKQIEESAVVSKQSGVVKEINENGMDSNGNNAAFMTILQEGEYRIKGSIDEQNVWMVTEGTPVVIRSRVDNSQTWKGTLAKLDTENVEKDDSDNSYGGSDSAVSSTKYPFYVELESAEGLLLGQHVYIEMDEGQEEEKEGLWLYSSYVVEDETGTYVWAANEKNRLEKRYVELGEFDEELGEYEILSGLTEDDYITWPMAGLYEGVATVTNMDEVDYSSPLYNQDGTEMLEEDFYYDTEMLEDEYDYDMEDEFYYDTEMLEEMDLINERQKNAEEEDAEVEE
ncbi:MAG: efflux RND transporter periplasmic adaptor subunit [Clostridiales bacterium]|nr:efflux RND transporter periplasmic adaptor subunit [Clostridiales bacterium]